MIQPFWCFLILIIILETTAMSLIESSVKHDSYTYLLAIVLYAIVSYLFYKLIGSSNRNGSTVNAIWNCSTTIGLTLIGVFYFQNKLHLNQFVGLCLAILSILFMESVISIE
jgi:multidrug transporter EmrE-like cation transporter